MNDISFAQVVPWLISGISMAVAVLAFLRNGKKDFSTSIESDTEFKVKVNSKLDQICATSNDIKTDIKAIQQEQRDHAEKIAVIKRDLETAFMRIDELRDAVNRMG